MCGLVGVVRVSDGSPVESAVVENMRDVMIHADANPVVDHQDGRETAGETRVEDGVHQGCSP